MALMSSPGMIQGMKQSMVAAPAMQMFMHALQANTEELEELVNQTLAKNPALEDRRAERADEVSLKEYDPRASQKHDFLLDSQTTTQTLGEYLEEQIRQSALPAKIEQAALCIIPYLNHRGFLSEAEPSICKELNIPPELFRRAKRAIQDLDPPGVGAEDLRESLILQLRRAGEKRGLPMLLLQHHWEALVKHRYAKVADLLEVEEEAVHIAAARIARLNPDPGSRFSRAEMNVITPDIVVETDGDDIIVSLTPQSSPQLALSSEYREMMAQHADNKEVRQFLSKCFRDGRDFLRILDDRKNTILTVAQAICDYQKAFFFEGKAALRPLKMEEIATKTGLHTSTVSRAVRGKYLKCAFGVSELRSFFISAVETDGNTETSSEEIRQKISMLIEDESPAAPLSDSAIAAALEQQGIRVARRTVTKYREQLKILPASLRKRR